LIAFGINYIASIGLDIWFLNDHFDDKKEKLSSNFTQEELEAKWKYNNYYEPKIDSLLETNPVIAIKYIDKLIKVYPKEYFLELSKGLAYYKIDSLELAIIEFRESMRKSGDEYPKALGYIGWTLSDLGRYDEAVFELKKAAKVNYDYNLDIAMVYEESGNLDSALYYYEKKLSQIKESKTMRMFYEEVLMIEEKIKLIKHKD
tara:strand:- start:458 stop:1066 length:609 start_codon:yes stop_codon:yes gene_type:complete